MKIYPSFFHVISLKNSYSHSRFINLNNNLQFLVQIIVITVYLFQYHLQLKLLQFNSNSFTCIYIELYCSKCSTNSISINSRKYYQQNLLTETKHNACELQFDTTILPQQSKVNKENQNPLLIVNQQEQLKLKGILPKNHFNQEITNRYQSTVSCYQQSLTKCPSSTSLQEQIERIVEKLKQKQQKETVQHNVDLNKYSIDEMIDILKNDRLLHIRSLQLQPSSNKDRQNSPKTVFPPLQLKQNFQSFETTKSSENETTTHKFSLKPQFNQLPKPKPIQKKESKDIIKPPEETRKKRTISLVIDPPPKKLTKKDRIQMALQNTHRIIQLCNHFTTQTIQQMKNYINQLKLKDLNYNSNISFNLAISPSILRFQIQQFNLHFFGNCRAQLQNFMNSQIKKYKDLRNAELEHQLQKENFNNALEVCLTKLKSKF